MRTVFFPLFSILILTLLIAVLDSGFRQSALNRSVQAESLEILLQDIERWNEPRLSRCGLVKEDSVAVAVLSVEYYSTSLSERMLEHFLWKAPALNLVQIKTFGFGQIDFEKHKETIAPFNSPFDYCANIEPIKKILGFYGGGQQAVRKYNGQILSNFENELYIQLVFELRRRMEERLTS